MKKSLSISFLTLMFLSLFNFEAKAAVSSWKGIYHGYSQDVSSLMGQYKPSLCSSVACSFGPFDTWANLNNISGGSYIVYTSQKCSQNCTNCAAGNLDQCVSCATGYSLTISGTGTICEKTCVFSSEADCLKVNNAQSCSKDNKNCYIPTCKPGYYLASGYSNGKITGYACLTGIAHCISHQGPNTCLACEDGYVSDGNSCVSECQFSSQSACLEAANVASCSQNDNGCYVPQQCNPGYVVLGSLNTSTNKVTYACLNHSDPHCIAAAPAKSPQQFCGACKDGYIMSGGKCLQNTATCPSGLTKSADGCCCVKQ